MWQKKVVLVHPSLPDQSLSVYPKLPKKVTNILGRFNQLETATRMHRLVIAPMGLVGVPHYCSSALPTQENLCLDRKYFLATAGIF